MVDAWREGFAFWWEMNVQIRWYSFCGKASAWWWLRRENARQRNPELRELDLWRRMPWLEEKLASYPNGIPLLLEALEVYSGTRQFAKHEQIRRRLESVDPGNPKVRESYPEAAKRQAETTVWSMSPAQKERLQRARRLVKETGRFSTATLQRRMGVSYNEAAALINVLREEQGVVTP